jgi:AhpD family alkylhydroperoxidase
MEAFEKLNEIQNLFSGIMENNPESGKNYMALIESVSKSSAIPAKYKELIYIALSLSGKCEWCLSYHLKLAVESGVTEKELEEASLIALLMAGTPALMESIKMKKFYSEIVGRKA